MVDPIADFAAKAPTSLFTLPSMTRLLLDTDLDLVTSAIADVQQQKAPRRDETQRRFTLAQHTVFVQLTRVLTHLQTTLQSSDKLGMNLFQALGPFLNDLPQPAQLSITTSRPQVLASFLFNCHPLRALAYFHSTLASPKDKASQLRAFVTVRELALHLVRTVDLARSTAGTAPTTSWLPLASVAVKCATTSTATDEQGRRGPTKLSLAAADAALSLVHVAALSVISNDQGSTCSVVGSLQELLAQLVDELVGWYSGVRHRTMFVLALHSFRRVTATSPLNQWVTHVHHSIPVFLSTYPHSARLVTRMISQLRLHPTEPAIRNLVCALGRVKAAKLRVDTQHDLLAVALDIMRANFSAEAVALATTLVQYLICHHWLTNGRHSPPWEWVRPVVEALVDRVAAVPATRCIAEIVALTNFPIAMLVTALECADTPTPVVANLLQLVEWMLKPVRPPSLVWSALLGVQVARPPRSCDLAMTQQLTPPVLMLYDHHPSIHIRRQAAKLLPFLDVSTTMAHYLIRLPSSHADATLAFLVASPAASRAAVSAALAGVLNLGWSAPATPTRSPADIEAPQASPDPSGHRQVALQAFTRWLERIPLECLAGITEDVVASFFRRPQDSISMVVLREFLRLHPQTFAQAWPVVQSHLQPHVGVVYESTSPLLLEKLRPLLALRMAPVSCLSNAAADSGPLVQMVVALMSEDGESEDIRKLAADVLAKLPPRTAIPIVLQHLQPLLEPLAPPGAWAALVAMWPWVSRPQMATPVSAKTASLMVYCVSVFVVNHPETQALWLRPVLELVMMAWAVPVTASARPHDMTRIERVQRGCIECMTVLLHHSSISSLPTTFEQWVECWLGGVFGGVLSVLEARPLPLPARLCCCNVLLNAIPRLDKSAMTKLVTESMPYMQDCLIDETSPPVVLSACLKLLMTLTKHHGFNGRTALPSGCDVVLATARLVACTQNAQISMEASQTIVVILSDAQASPNLVTTECLQSMARILQKASDNPHVDADTRGVARTLVDWIASLLK